MCVTQHCLPARQTVIACLGSTEAERTWMFSQGRGMKWHTDDQSEIYRKLLDDQELEKAASTQKTEDQAVCFVLFLYLHDLARHQERITPGSSRTFWVTNVLLQWSLIFQNLKLGDIQYNITFRLLCMCIYIYTWHKFQIEWVSKNLKLLYSMFWL